MSLLVSRLTDDFTRVTTDFQMIIEELSPLSSSDRKTRAQTKKDTLYGMVSTLQHVKAQLTCLQEAMEKNIAQKRCAFEFSPTEINELATNTCKKLSAILEKMKEWGLKKPKLQREQSMPCDIALAQRYFDRRHAISLASSSDVSPPLERGSTVSTLRGSGAASSEPPTT